MDPLVTETLQLIEYDLRVLIELLGVVVAWLVFNFILWEPIKRFLKW